MSRIIIIYDKVVVKIISLEEKMCDSFSKKKNLKLKFLLEVSNNGVREDVEILQ